MPGGIWLGHDDLLASVGSDINHKWRLEICVRHFFFANRKEREAKNILAETWRAGFGISQQLKIGVAQRELVLTIDDLNRQADKTQLWRADALDKNDRFGGWHFQKQELGLVHEAE